MSTNREGATRNEIGLLGERLVADRIRALGLAATPMPPRSPYDLNVEGVRVEVKTASTPYKTAKYPSRTFAAFGTQKTRSNGRSTPRHKDYAADSDFMVCLWTGAEGIPTRCWVIPSGLVPPGLQIRIDADRKRSSKWDVYEDRFDLIASFEPATKSITPHVIPVTEEHRAKMSAGGRRGAAQTHQLRRQASEAAIRDALVKLRALGIDAPTNRQLAKAAGLSRETVIRYRRKAATLV